MIDLVRDGAPAIFGIGIVSAVFVSVGLVIGFLRDAERKRWLAVLGLWSLPGYLFWLCIAGNNIRHVMAFGIPLFWFAAKYLDSRYVAACLALTLIVPGNSNVFMYPSPNVPASARLFGRKQLYLHSVANDLSKQSSCFVGSYTSDYLVAILLDQGGHIDSQESRTDASAAVVTMPNGVNITFKRISRTQKAVDLGSCKSLEYDQDGRKVHPFGGEWRIPII